MTKDEFTSLISNSFSTGDILNNPGGGISTLVSVGPDKPSRGFNSLKAAFRAWGKAEIRFL